MNDREFLALLHKFRDESALPLAFAPSIEVLLDAVHCQAITKLLHAERRWERRTAVAGLGDFLPDQSGLYMFVWRPEFSLQVAESIQQFSWILYIGKAGTEDGTQDTLRSRFNAEYRHYVQGDVSNIWNPKPPTDRAERLARYLALRPLEYWFLTMDSPRDIAILERKLIKMFGPPLNVQHGPKLRAGKTVPAFEEIK